MNKDRFKNVVEQYDSVMNHNFLVRYLHEIRFKKIIEVFSELSSKKAGEPISIVDIGCANGKLFGVLARQFNVSYLGIEPSKDFVDMARKQYGHCENFQVIQDTVMNHLELLEGKDIIVALETFEHIKEHEVVRIVEAIAEARPAYLVSSVPVEIGPAIWFKNAGSFLFGYSRHLEYTWRETFWSGLYMLDKLEPHDFRHKGFDWRWLAQTIRHNMKIIQFSKFPLNFLPAAFAFSVYFIAKPRA